MKTSPTPSSIRSFADKVVYLIGQLDNASRSTDSVLNNRLRIRIRLLDNWRIGSFRQAVQYSAELLLDFLVCLIRVFSSLNVIVMLELPRDEDERISSIPGTVFKAPSIGSVTSVSISPGQHPDLSCGSRSLEDRSWEIDRHQA
jgi:hypothetical protein